MLRLPVTLARSSVPPWMPQPVMYRDSSPIFYLVGIPSLQKLLFLPVFFIFLFFYLLILVGNILILVAVVAEPSLHKPIALLLSIPAVVQTSHMAFGPVAQVYHCFCDHLAVVQASCSDTTPQTFMGFYIAMVVSFLPLLLVFFKYIPRIVHTNLV
ncbi:hypothetical protein HPG69_012119 [Diceros bicornis minor]|uniref:Olfactory receptor n=1 Tax=Diceros bicornis minor TaxID=77932 RepID=A0A7J7EIX3_DICBM|nr:hypothetical protein HPG69_012119 [Diceros bicornis minor]